MRSALGIWYANAINQEDIIDQTSTYIIDQVGLQYIIYQYLHTL